MSHLAKECGGNVHVKGVVDISASSTTYDVLECHQVTDYGGNGAWCSFDEPNSWICFDFKEKSVRLTGYSLETAVLLHWVIEGSNDGSTWRELDRRDTEVLRCKWRVKTYSCCEGVTESFRFLRLRQTGKNFSGHGALSLASVEFFGTLHRGLAKEGMRKRIMREEVERRRNGSFSFIHEIDYMDGFGPFNGIISHLRDECGGNVHVKGVVNITSSDGDDNCHQVTNYERNDAWLWRDEANLWISFDFKEKSVRPTGYSLKSTGVWRSGHLVHWVIEGSNDGSTWRELDRRDTEDLNGRWIVKTYSCCEGMTESFRFLRLRQTGKNSGGNDRIYLARVEFFGTLNDDAERAEMRRRLLCEEEERRRRGEFRFCDDRPFWGIISGLSEECGGNVHVKGVVNVTASDGNDNCHQVTVYARNDAWSSEDEPNSWICFDFKEKSVRLTGYSLKSGSWGSLLHWVIEGSNDGSSWCELDHRDTEDLNDVYRVKTYSCGEGMTESFRFLRLRQTGENSFEENNLCLTSVEFFGTLFRNSSS